jgi:L-lactate dehydrogenase (cytochrome)
MVALGAHGVLLGRAWAYALAAGGGPYVANMLDTMQRELAAAMAMAGRTRISAIDRTVLDR